MALSRREILRAGGIGLLTFWVAGCERKLTPAQARVEGASLRTLRSAEAAAIDVLGESLLPGSAASGLAHYIDHQLSGPAGDSMLMIKYLGIRAPFADFYRTGLAAFDEVARAQLNVPAQSLAVEQASTLVAQLASAAVPGWKGPPPGLFYFVMRSDAVDVVYGTVAGFQALGVPYMPHIAPPDGWRA